MVHSPAEFIRRPKISTESATLGLDRMELGAFIACGEAGSPTDHAVACLLGLLGLRVSEACSIDVEDVGRPLLLARSGNRLNRHAATRIVRRLAKAAGITKHISPHSLRHSFITACLDAGVPLRDVQIAARPRGPKGSLMNLLRSLCSKFGPADVLGCACSTHPRPSWSVVVTERW